MLFDSPKCYIAPPVMPDVSSCCDNVQVQTFKKPQFSVEDSSCQQSIDSEDSWKMWNLKMQHSQRVMHNGVI